MSEARRIFLGVVDVDEGSTIALNISPDTPVGAIREAIAKANTERAEAATRESEALARMFLDRAAIERGDK